MQQKMVIDVPLRGEKSKSKAMKIAVLMRGVSSVSIGKENDELVVTGDGIDSVCLNQALRKHFCFADIKCVEEVKPPKQPDPWPRLPASFSDAAASVPALSFGLP